MSGYDQLDSTANHRDEACAFLDDADWVRFVHNTIVSSRNTGDGTLNFTFTGSLELRNNIVVNRGTDDCVTVGGGISLLESHNVFDGAASDPWAGFTPDGTSNQDTVTFIDESGLDFRLDDASAAGLSDGLAGLETLDIDGTPFDVSSPNRGCFAISVTSGGGGDTKTISIVRDTFSAPHETLTASSIESGNFDASGCDYLLLGTVYEQGTVPSAVLSASFAGNLLTQLRKQAAAGSNEFHENIEWWGLDTPDPGTNTWQVHFSGTDHDAAIVLVGLAGTSHTTPTGDTDGNSQVSNPSGNEALVLTTTKRNSMIFGAMCTAAATATPYAPDVETPSITEALDTTVASGVTGFSYWIGYVQTSGTGNYNIGATASHAVSRATVIAAVEMRAADVGSSVPGAGGQRSIYSALGTGEIFPGVLSGFVN